MIQNDQKPQLVVIGASRGIGKAMAEGFQNDFKVVTVSRTSGDYVGDVTDRSFRNHLLANINPYVFINCAGVYPSEEDPAASIETNLVATCHFTIELAKKMRSGFIFNMSSIAVTDFRKLSLANVTYASTKRMLSDLSQSAEHLSPKVRVCTLEPGFVSTDFADINNRYIAQAPDDYLTQRRIRPMSPAYLVSVVRWIMAQPEDVSISNIRISNK
jgi:short-subunit dehydrogenase